ncbi:hypothetical protein DL769_010057 [Monosporascus sp. CRB-8-3]|nr:hypothetical protein DL769_010057 [Monosporascus sp. CRB-8-3]
MVTLSLRFDSLQILMIEVGSAASNRADILYPNATNDAYSQFSWGYKSVPQAHMDNREVDQPAWSGGWTYMSTPTNVNRTYPLSEALEESWDAIGDPTHPYYGINAGNSIGLGELHENNTDRWRQIANVRYPLGGVTVLTETWVKEAVLDTTCDVSRAIGVELQNGVQCFSREAMVSAGAYWSSQASCCAGSDQPTS